MRNPPPLPPLSSIAMGFLAFYGMAAALIAGAVAVHEGAHLVAHEGFTVPDVTFQPGVDAAESNLLATYPYDVGGRQVSVRQPPATVISFYPNLVLNALGLGVVPAGSYSDGGVLASTFFHLERHEVPEIVARGGHMPPAVQVAPLVVAAVMFVACALWVLAFPNLFNRALLWAYAIQVGDNSHHAVEVGMDPNLFAGITALVMAIAVVLVCVRSKTFRALAASRAPGRIVRPAIMRPTRAPWRPGDARPVAALVGTRPVVATRPLVAARPAPIRTSPVAALARPATRAPALLAAAASQRASRRALPAVRSSARPRLGSPIAAKSAGRRGVHAAA